MSTPSLAPLTFFQIVQQMANQARIYALANNLPVNDFLEGSLARTIFEATGAPIEELFYLITVDAPGRFFFDSATGDDLERLVQNFTFGLVSRIPSATAAGPLLVEGEDGTVIPSGSTFVAPSGQVVSILAPGGLIAAGQGGVVTVGGQAAQAGAAGNLAAGTVLTPQPAIPGVVQATVPTAWAGGLDEQSDEALRDSVVAFLNSLTRATRPALVAGALANGYQRAFVSSPSSARILVYVDDGLPANPTKLASTEADLIANWASAGSRVRVLAFQPYPVTLNAEAFAGPGVTKAQMQAAIEGKWAVLLAGKRMGDTLTRAELIREASTVPSYNGVNLDFVDLVQRPVQDYYNSRFGPGDILPYARPVLDQVVWS